VRPVGVVVIAYSLRMWWRCRRPAMSMRSVHSRLALAIHRSQIALPGHLGTPVWRSWTDTGTTRQERQLKHRPKGTVRPVPIPPALVRLILKHLDQHGTTSDGRLFRGLRSGILSESTYGRVWAKARVIALADAQVASTLAKHPYDLRHACVSTWLKAGTEPKRVAEWAGHSVTVLLRIYTHCLDGGENEALRRIQKALADTGDQAKMPRSTSGRIWGEQSLAPSDGNGQSPSLADSDD
jgi:hypothetical protein